ncbi:MULTISPECIES: PepSY domain-containing protein [unclassified Thioclava]|uniref:PepSY domain-containing protein n=1 Tax=unclassified Thioclava TaxID=2621713 RepID=UPI000997E321|nr:MULTISPECIES: PepSY domain-containing protein [unclassified Thioclava]OOY16052.1 hypothetical protein BMI85_11000 [Thioclava sp. DLFJ4-1]OOY20572.1 hypothetical protein BMI86_08535 [Thioclava sp. DLFJ5-1]OOY30543.1 hypothetical protein BMI88_15360 [Thioclava sp. F36-6]
MKMKSTLAALAALAVSAHMAQAEVSTDGIAADLQANGFTNVEIKVGPTQVKAEGYNPNGTKIEVVYDRATGKIQKQEMSRTRAGYDMTQGVSVRQQSEDFYDGSDDDHMDDHGDDHSGSDDHMDDSHDDDHTTSDSDHSSDDGGSHESGSDDGGSHDSGSDGGGSHDSGGDDGGDDD